MPGEAWYLHRVMIMRELPMDRSNTAGSRLTAGDVSRALGVDLKTVHNWVQRGHLRGARTKGRHLRFLRTEVVRFLRRRGRPIPEGIALRSPRVVAAGTEAPMAGHADVQRREGLFDALLEFGNSEYDVLVVGLSCLDEQHARELPEALQRQAATQGIAVVGVGGSPEVAQAFLAGGADMVSTSTEDLEMALAVVTGVRTEVAAHPGGQTHRGSGTFQCVSIPAAQAC